jgi:transcriptional regulator with XRE-family HTH domain
MNVQDALQQRVLPAPGRRRSLRVSLGLTLDDMAEMLEVSRSAVSRWERGVRQPRRHHRTRYLALLRQLESRGREVNS